MEERIQKILSAAGVSSRRAAEAIILEGRVRVNGKVVSELGAKADPDKDHIKVDGKLINPKQPQTYIMLNKPAGFVTTMSDPEGRPIVANLLKGVKVRVYPVGRLDYDTEGLLLLTNDGDLAHLVTHPKHELPKTYLVKVKGFLEDRHIEMLEQGVFLKDGKTAPARVRKLRKEEANSWVEITIHEGRKRQVRRMIDHTGHSVIKLKRTRVGSLSLGDLPVGMFRHLTLDEVQGLRQMAMQEEAKQPAPRIVAPKKSVEAVVKPVRREETDARRAESVSDDAPMWGRGEEKQRSRERSREKLMRNVVEVRDGAARRPGALERTRAVSATRTPVAEGARTADRGPTRGPAEGWQRKPEDKTVHAAAADRRPRVEGAGRPTFGEPRSEKRPRWSEQRGASAGPARLSGDRPRPASFTAGRTRPDARGARPGGGESGYGEKRTARPSFGGKMSGTREGSSSGRPPRPSGDRPRSASFTTGRPRPDARGVRPGGGESGYGEKRTARPSFGGKVHGTREGGTSGRPFRPSSERARPAGFATGRPRSDAHGARPGSGLSGSGEKRAPRPAFGGKVYAPREGGASARPSRPTGDRARPTGFPTGRPRPDARGARPGGSGAGSGEKRTPRPAFGGKVYGTRKRGPVNASGPRPGGPKRTGPRTSGPRPGGTRGPRSRRS